MTLTDLPSQPSQLASVGSSGFEGAFEFSSALRVPDVHQEHGAAQVGHFVVQANRVVGERQRVNGWNR